MRVVLTLVILVLSSLHPQAVRAGGDEAQGKVNVNELLANYQKELDAIDSAYQKIATLQPPLRYASGTVLSSEMVESHRKSVSRARRTFHEFQANPRNLEAAIRLVIRTEALTDDLTSLAELSYDSDQEDLAQSLNQLTANVDRNKHLIEAWALQLASQMHQHVQKLERENRNLSLQLNRIKEQQSPKNPPAH